MSRYESHEKFIEFLDDRYGHVLSPVLLDIEQETQGTREGASSWSSIEHVSDMALASALSVGDVFLDVGCGTGWSAIRIALETGANPFLIDLPEGVLGIAREMAVGRGVDVEVARADVTELPFKDSFFDAVTHSDVLCCLPEKEAAIAECARVLRPEGKMVFGVIHVNHEAPLDEVTRRFGDAPDYVISDQPYPAMLRDAGFKVEAVDWTTDFRGRAVRLEEARKQRVNALVELFGEEEAQDMVERARWNIDAIDDDIVRRSFYVATLP